MSTWSFLGWCVAAGIGGGFAISMLGVSVAFAVQMVGTEAANVRRRMR